MKTKLYSLAVLIAASLFLFSCSEDDADITVSIPPIAVSFNADLTDNETPTNSIALRADEGLRPFSGFTVLTGTDIDLSAIKGKIKDINAETIKITVYSEDGSVIKNVILGSQANVSTSTIFGDITFSNSFTIDQLSLNNGTYSIPAAQYAWIKAIPFELATGVNVAVGISGLTDLAEEGIINITLEFIGVKATYNPLK